MPLKVFIWVMLFSHVVSIMMFQDVQDTLAEKEVEMKSIRRTTAEIYQEVHKLKKLL